MAISARHACAVGYGEHGGIAGPGFDAVVAGSEDADGFAEREHAAVWFVTAAGDVLEVDGAQVGISFDEVEPPVCLEGAAQSGEHLVGGGGFVVCHQVGADGRSVLESERVPDDVVQGCAWHQGGSEASVALSFCVRYCA